MKRPLDRRMLAVLVSLTAAACAGAERAPTRGPGDLPEPVRARLAALSPAELPPLPPDVTNRHADDPRAALLGQRLFFDTRFSGPLLDESNNGVPGTLGKHGETGKVACASCHIPEFGFLDARSPRRQVSLGSGWTRRRAPSLLNVARASFLMWDGRHDTAFSQIFTPIEDARELNSSALFVAQQIGRLYRTEFQALFGPFPGLGRYPVLAPAEAGCSSLPPDPTFSRCEKPGSKDAAVIRVVVNAGKAIQAYTRKLECGRSRFDRWMDGDRAALTDEERAGALLFVGKGGCDTCHSGPFLSDQRFHNVGLTASFTFFVAPFQDPGAAEGLRRAFADPLGSTGRFSDGYDGRRERIPRDRLLGAFRTPSLRCVGRRPSYMHTGQFRSLEDVVLFFNRGGDPPRGAPSGYLGVSENHPRGLSATERAELVAFLRALDGEGPPPELVSAPILP